MSLRWLYAITLLSSITSSSIALSGMTPSHSVYHIYKEVDLGDEKAPPQKDYYVSIGTNDGVKRGTLLEVFRQTSTYDGMTQEHYQDIAVPFAVLKVIHSEPNVAIARLEKFFKADRTPITNPNSVILGDIVRIQKITAQAVSKTSAQPNEATSSPKVEVLKTPQEASKDLKDPKSQ